MGANPQQTVGREVLLPYGVWVSARTRYKNTAHELAQISNVQAFTKMASHPLSWHACCDLMGKITSD